MAFEYLNTQYVPTVDLATVGHNYEILSNRHQENIKLKSGIDQAIGALDLNEAEDGFKAGLAQQIDAEINSAADDGFLGNATGAIMKGVSLASIANPAVKGRLLAQQEYKKFQERINNDPTLPENYKDYFKENNPYYYQDKINSKGLVIGGTAWTPKDGPTKIVDFSEVLREGINLAARESGGGSSIRYLDAEGNITNDFRKSVTGEYFDSTTSKWERLSEDKIRQGIEAVMRNKPGVRASLEQDYKVSLYDNSKGNPSDILDKNGQIMMFDEWLNARIDPAVKAAKYYNVSSSTTYGDAVKSNLALQQSISQQGNNTNGLAGFDDKGDSFGYKVSTSDPMEVEDNSTVLATANLTNNYKLMGELFKAAHIKLTKGIEQYSSDKLDEVVNSNWVRKNLNPAARAQLLDLKDAILEDREYINSKKQSMSDDDKNKVDLYDAVMSNSNIPIKTSKGENNKYSERYNRFINRFFNGYRQSIIQYFADDDTYENALNILGGEKNAKALGIDVVTSSNGKKGIKISEGNKNSLYNFFTAIDQAKNNTHNIFGSVWQGIKHGIYHKFGDNLMAIDNNGNEVKLSLGGLPSGFTSFINNLKKDKDRALSNFGKNTVSTEIYPYVTPKAADYNVLANYDIDNASKYHTLIDMEKENIAIALKDISVIQTGCYITEGSKYVKCEDTDKMLTITDLLRNVNDNDLSTSIAPDPTTGRIGLMVTIKGDVKSDDDKLVLAKGQKIFIPDAITDSAFQSWNNDSNFKASYTTKSNYNIGRNTRIGSSGLGLDNMYLVPKGDGFVIKTGENSKKYGIENGFYVDKEKAVKIREAYDNISRTRNKILAGEFVQPSSVEAIIKNQANVLADLSNSSKKQQVANAIYELLVNQFSNSLSN